MSSAIEGNVSATQEKYAGYLPSIWDHQFLIDFTPSFADEDEHAMRLEALKEDVKKLIASTSKEDPRDLLNLIDTLQRLGVAYHFEKEINGALHLLYSYIPTDLHHIALHFRLLRNNGFCINSDAAFSKFVDEGGKFKDNLKEDVKGLLSLYEAAHLGIPEEDILEEAKIFSAKHLKLLAAKLENELSEQIKKSMEVPLQRRMSRSEARNFIDAYEKDDANNPALLKLAKLDFNVVQSIYLKEIKELAQWWKELDIEKKIPFTRDRLVQSYVNALGAIPDPQFSKGRKNIAKYATIAVFVDYAYDTYGSIDELENFTEALNRWDTKAVEELPDYMKVCYIALCKSVEDASNDISLDLYTYLKDNWVGYCKAMLKEARWNKSGYVPSFDEHINNAWITIGVALGMTISYFDIVRDSKAEYSSYCVQNWSTSELFYRAGLMGRLLNDFVTYKIERERGEQINSINCYMMEHGVTEEEAQDHIRNQIDYSWKKLNELVVRYSYPHRFVKVAMDMARCFHQMYKYDDFFGLQTQSNTDCVSKLLFESIQMD